MPSSGTTGQTNGGQRCSVRPSGSALSGGTRWASKKTRLRVRATNQPVRRRPGRQGNGTPTTGRQRRRAISRKVSRHRVPQDRPAYALCRTSPAERDPRLAASGHSAFAITSLTGIAATSAAPAAGAPAKTAIYPCSTSAARTLHFAPGNLTLTAWAGSRGYSLADLEEDRHTSPIFLTWTSLPHETLRVRQYARVRLTRFLRRGRRRPGSPSSGSSRASPRVVRPGRGGC